MPRQRDGPDDRHVQFLGGKEILHEITHLPSPERECAALFFQAGKSIREIAAILGLDLDETVAHLHRAKSQIKSKLKVECQTK